MGSEKVGVKSESDAFWYGWLLGRAMLFPYSHYEKNLPMLIGKILIAKINELESRIKELEEPEPTTTDVNMDKLLDECTKRYMP
jgi:hypothetical protein